MITNKTNGKSYIGLAQNIKKRWEEHRSYTRQDTSKNLYWAFKEYGIENFEFKILKEVEINKLGYWEREFIKEYDTYNNGYNSSHGGEGSTTDTLSDKYNINYEIQAHDCLTYERNDSELSKFNKFTSKYDKKEYIFNAKISKKISKEKNVIKLKSKKDKKLFKIKMKIDFWDALYREINDRNNEKRSSIFVPMSNYANLQMQDFDTFTSSIFLNSVKMKAIRITRFQRNNTKYKKLNVINTIGEVKFSKNKFIFSPTGFKNTNLLYEELKFIHFRAFNDYYELSFNNAVNEFHSLDGSDMHTSDEVIYPEGNVLNFRDLNELKRFIVTIRSKIGY